MSYTNHLIIYGCWPLLLILLFSTCFMALEFSRTPWYKVTFVEKMEHAIVAGLRRTVPGLLVITFLLVPMESMHIFESFLCKRIEYSSRTHSFRRYLADDLTVSCDSKDYQDVRDTAFILLAVWPVCVPVLYSVLLAIVRRRSLLNSRRRRPSKEEQTPMSIATTFLWADYRAGACLWEPLEMCRKLVLTGWILLIGEDFEQARVLIAIMISVLFLVLHLTFRPLLR